MVQVDWKARIIWLPNATKYNHPKSPNVVRSWRDHWDNTPECELKARAYQALKAFAGGLGKGFAQAFREALGEGSGKPLANQEQEQEQERSFCSAAASQAAEPSPEVGVGKGPDDEVVIVYEIIGTPKGSPKTWGLTRGKLREYRETFAGIDVDAELHLAQQWCRNNPNKRKTRDGMTPFLCQWMMRVYNRTRNYRSDLPQRSSVPTTAKRMAEAARPLEESERRREEIRNGPPRAKLGGPRPPAAAPPPPANRLCRRNRRLCPKMTTRRFRDCGIWDRRNACRRRIWPPSGLAWGQCCATTSPSPRCCRPPRCEAGRGAGGHRREPPTAITFADPRHYKLMPDLVAKFESERINRKLQPVGGAE